MAWNEPGGSGDKDPWGRKREQGPPDLDRIVKDLQNKIAGLFGGRKRGGGGGGGGGSSGGPSRFGIGLILLVAFGVWIATGLYVVNEGQRAVILRFGEKSAVAMPGLSWRFPFPIERHEIVNVDKIYNLTLGYKTDRSGSKQKVQSEALMLTKDEKIIDIELAVMYRIKDPNQYLFNVNDPATTVSQASESAVREVVGQTPFDVIYTSGRAQVERATLTILQEMLDRYGSGIVIHRVEMQEAQAPAETKAAFEDAVKAREDKERLQNEASAYFKDVVPRARGAAARVMQEADGYSASVIQRAEGDAKRFSQVVSEYAKAPGVTRERMYIEAMEQVFGNTTKILVDQKGGNSMLYLPIDKMLSKPANVPMNQPRVYEEAVPAMNPADAARQRSNLRDR